MTIKLFGVNVMISPLFFPLITFLLIVDKFGTAVPVISALLLHELGHIIAIKLIGQKIWNVKLLPSAVVMGYSSYNRFAGDIFVALAGVLANSVALFSAIILEQILSLELTYFVAANICIGGLNLLPFEGLDGGTVLNLVFKGKLAIKKGITLAFLLIFTLGIMALFKKYGINLSAVAFAVYIFATFLFKV